MTRSHLLFRIGVAAIIAAFLGWMLLDISPFEKQAKLLEREISRQTIGLPKDADEKRLSELIRALVARAGVDIPIVINDTARRGALNIYITTPTARHVTGVDFGNAAYDPVLDAIYIDQSFIDHGVYLSLCRGSEIGMLGCRERYPSLDVLFAFVLLHELGHRQLHGVGSGWLAHDKHHGKVRAWEHEADLYALKALKDNYKTGTTVVSDDDQADTLREALGLREFAQTAEDNAQAMWSDLVAALFMSSLLNSFLGGPYSPFYTDLAHPSFLVRSSGLIDAALQDKSLHPMVREHFEFFKDMLLKQSTASQALAAELISAEPIVDSGFAGGSVSFLTDRGRRLAELPLKSLGRENGSKVAAVLQPELRPGHTPDASQEVTWPSGWAHGRSKVYWPLSDGALLVVEADGTRAHVRTGGKWRETSFPAQTNRCFNLWRGPDPSEFALAIHCPTDGPSELVGIKNGTALARRSVDELTKELRSRLGDKTLTLNLLKDGDLEPTVTVEHDLVALMAESSATADAQGASEDKTSVQVAVAVLDLHSLKVLKTIPLDGAKAKKAEDIELRFLAYPHRDQGAVTAQVFTLTKDANAIAQSRWRVARMPAPGQVGHGGHGDAPSSVAPAEIVLGQPGQTLPPALAREFESQLVSSRFIGQNQLLLNFEGDGSYIVDFRRQRSQLLFSLGGSAMSFSTSRSGHVAAYFRGGQKLYVFAIDTPGEPPGAQRPQR